MIDKETMVCMMQLDFNTSMQQGACCVFVCFSGYMQVCGMKQRLLAQQWYSTPRCFLLKLTSLVRYSRLRMACKMTGGGMSRLRHCPVHTFQNHSAPVSPYQMIFLVLNNLLLSTLLDHALSLLRLIILHQRRAKSAACHQNAATKVTPSNIELKSASSQACRCQFVMGNALVHIQG